DPRCRSWYVNSKSVRNTVIFTEPYNDAGTGTVLISASHSITDASNNLLGVVAVDVGMDSLEAAIVSEKILQNGYSYLIDSSGNVVVYPALQRDKVYKIWDVEFTDQTESSTFKTTIF